MGICRDVTEAVGDTPLIRLGRVGRGLGATVLGKLEGANPGGSVKDRIAVSMIDAAEREVKLRPGGTIIEPTSGNTGIGLALVAAARGYRLVLTMPESMSLERRQLLAALGAELVLTPAAEGMSGAVAKAEGLVRETPGAFMPQQFKNPANPEIHRQTTAEEIWRDTGGAVGAFVAGVGTGGTLMGIARKIKSKNLKVKIIAVEPAESAVLSGGSPGKHRIEGIGEGFVPPLVKKELIDEVLPVSSREALETAANLARSEGLLAGISSGANIAASLVIAGRIKMGNIFTVLPDRAERYL